MQVPFEANETDLQDFFQQFGSLVNVKILRNMDGSNKSKGCGFVTYSCQQEAEMAMAQVDQQQTLPGSGNARPLSVHFAKVVTLARAARHCGWVVRDGSQKRFPGG